MLRDKYDARPVLNVVLLPCQACSEHDTERLQHELFSSWLGFSCCFRGLYYITTDVFSLSKKMAAALIVTGECGTEIVAHNNSKIMQCSPQHIQLETCIPLDSVP